MVESKEKVIKRDRSASLPFYDSVQKIKNSIGQFESKTISKNEMRILMSTEDDFPIIPIDGKCYLLAVNKKSYTGLIWIATWFEVDSVYRDRNNSHYVKLNVNDKFIEVPLDVFYPKDITSLTKYGIVFDQPKVLVVISAPYRISLRNTEN